MFAGIGKTVKEKVCVHTSRDIRAVAGQLVKLWIEVFRREKAAHGLVKSTKKSTGGSPNAMIGNLKMRSKDTQKCTLATGKQPDGLVTGDSKAWPSAQSASPSGETISAGQSKVRF